MARSSQRSISARCLRSIGAGARFMPCICSPPARLTRRPKRSSSPAGRCRVPMPLVNRTARRILRSSGVYRVRYTGSAATAPIEREPQTTPERELHKQLAAFHGKQDPKAVATAWPQLGHKDRSIRAAARTVLEHQPVAEWESKALKEK